jgi:hypothetical protein
MKVIDSQGRTKISVSLETGASLSFSTVSSNTTLGITYNAVSVIAAGTTITLPTAVDIVGKFYVIDNASTGDITVTTTSNQTIEGLIEQTLPPDSCIQVFSDGENWRIM